jgi:hypothetical protein
MSPAPGPTLVPGHERASSDTMMGDAPEDEETTINFLLNRMAAITATLSKPSTRINLRANDTVAINGHLNEIEQILGRSTEFKSAQTSEIDEVDIDLDNPEALRNLLGESWIRKIVTT